MQTPSWLTLCGLLALAGNVLAADIAEVEITSDPPEGGQQIFTVRLRPGKTQTMDKVLFECTLHQEFTAAAPGSTNIEKRVIESSVFSYRRRDVKLTEDLDCFISFRVPVSLARIKEIFGDTAYETKAPITVSKMHISGLDKADTCLWRFETEARGQRAPEMEIQSPNE
jgi:hypothetical protein